MSSGEVTSHAHERIQSPPLDLGPHIPSPIAFFRIACFRFHLKALTPIELPPFSGSTFHGGFGHALRRVSPHFFRYFFQPKCPPDLFAKLRRSTPPKPFVLAPPPVGLEHLAPGETLTLDLTLFGNAIRHFSVCFLAIQTLGRNGLGRLRGNYAVDGVEALDMYGRPRLIYSGADERWLGEGETIESLSVKAAVSGKTWSKVTLDFITWMRFQSDNSLVTWQPSFALFFSRLAERLNMLSAVYCSEELISKPELQVLREAAERIALDEGGSQLAWQPWQRFSGRQKDWMKFDGIAGRITYEGNLTPFMPWLALGEWVHVGGKTSFGLGAYRIVDTLP